MPRLAFTRNIQRHVACQDTEAAGATVREVLENFFAANPRARAYILDDQSALRKHMAIYLDGELINDRLGLSDPTFGVREIHVFQALSGG